MGHWNLPSSSRLLMTELPCRLLSLLFVAPLQPLHHNKLHPVYAWTSALASSSFSQAITSWTPLIISFTSSTSSLPVRSNSTYRECRRLWHRKQNHRSHVPGDFVQRT